MRSSLRPIWVDTLTQFLAAFGPLALIQYCGHYNELGHVKVVQETDTPEEKRSKEQGNRRNNFARRALVRLLDWLAMVNTLPTGTFTATWDVQPIVSLVVAAVACAMTATQEWSTIAVTVGSPRHFALAAQVRGCAFVVSLCSQKIAQVRAEEVAAAAQLLQLALKVLGVVSPGVTGAVVRGVRWIADLTVTTDVFRELVSSPTATHAINIEVEKFHTAVAGLSPAGVMYEGFPPDPVDPNLPKPRKAREDAITGAWSTGFLARV